MSGERDCSGRVLTLRALALGTVVAAAIPWIVHHAALIMHASRVNLSMFPVILFFLFFAIVLGNSLLKALLPRRSSLSPGETLLVLAMGFMGSEMPGTRLVGSWLGVLSMPYYYASPQNRWTQILHPHMPAWANPHNVGGALDSFFEGLPPSESIFAWHLWSVWVTPLFWWLTLVVALVFACICVNVLLRKQWVEHERLSFPLAPDLDRNIYGRFATKFIPRNFVVGRDGTIKWSSIGYDAKQFKKMVSVIKKELAGK